MYTQKSKRKQKMYPKNYAQKVPKSDGWVESVLTQQQKEQKTFLCAM